LGEKLNVFAKTNEPSASRIHIPIPVMFRELEKEASTLHFSLSCRERCQAEADDGDDAMSGGAEGSPREGALGGVWLWMVAFAVLQSSIR
jgi:hypothetical protein